MKPLPFPFDCEVLDVVDVVLRCSSRPVFWRARSRVENSVGRMFRRQRAGGGGRRIESRPWIRPFDAPFFILLVSFLVY